MTEMIAHLLCERLPLPVLLKMEAVVIVLWKWYWLNILSCVVLYSGSCLNKTRTLLCLSSFFKSGLLTWLSWKIRDMAKGLWTLFSIMECFFPEWLFPYPSLCFWPQSNDFRCPPSTSWSFSETVSSCILNTNSAGNFNEAVTTASTQTKNQKSISTHSLPNNSQHIHQRNKEELQTSWTEMDDGPSGAVTWNHERTHDNLSENRGQILLFLRHQFSSSLQNHQSHNEPSSEQTDWSLQ